MKKWLNTLALCLMLCLLSGVRAAAADQVMVELSDVETTSGSELVVALSVKNEDGSEAENIGAVELTLSFDPNLLFFREITGGFANAAVEDRIGTVTIQDGVSGNEGGAYTAELHFLAQQPGDAQIRITDCTVFNAEGETIRSGMKDGVVTIVDSCIDTSLYMLVVDPGILSPEFSPECTTYRVTMTYDNPFITVAARPNNYWAQSYVEGHSVLEIGKNNIVHVNVIGGDGASHRVYTLIVPRGVVEERAEEEPVEIPTAELPAETAAETPAETSAETTPVVILPAESAEPEAAGEETAEPEAEEQEFTDAPEETTKAGTSEAEAAGTAETEVPEESAGTVQRSELEETREALNEALEQANRLQHAAKIATLAAMAELLIIVILAYLLGRTLRDDEDEEDYTPRKRRNARNEEDEDDFEDDLFILDETAAEEAESER